MDLIEELKEIKRRLELLEKQRAIGKTTYTNQGSAPATPATGATVLYFKSDKKLYYKRDDGTEVLVV